MPRYASQNLANFDSDSNRMPGTGGGGSKKRHNFGKQVLIASGQKMVGEGMCIRLIPTYDVDSTGGRVLDSAGNSVLSQFFLNDDRSQGFGDWQRLYECVHFFGHPGCSFIVWDGNNAVNKWESPAWLLFTASSEVRKNEVGGPIGRLFAELRNTKDGFGSNSHVGSLKAPQPMLFISGSQVFVREDGSLGLSVYEQTDRNARIFGLTKTAMQSFHNALRVEDDMGHLACGDLLSMDAAKLVTIMPTGYGRGTKLPKPAAISTEGPDYVFVPSYAGPVDPNEVVVLGKPNPKPDQADGGKSHSVVLHDYFMKHQIDLRQYEDEIFNKNCTFDEMMYVPSHEEQAEIMADAFPREALDYAWRDYPSYLRVLPTGRTTVEAVAPQQETPQPKPAVQRSAPKPAAKPAIEPPAAMNVQDVPAADDFDVAPVAKPAIPPGATIPPPAKLGAAASAALAKARAIKRS